MLLFRLLALGESYWNTGDVGGWGGGGVDSQGRPLPGGSSTNTQAGPSGAEIQLFPASPLLLHGKRQQHGAHTRMESAHSFFSRQTNMSSGCTLFARSVLQRLSTPCQCLSVSRAMHPGFRTCRRLAWPGCGAAGADGTWMLYFRQPF